MSLTNEDGTSGAGCRADCECNGRGECNAEDTACECYANQVGETCNLVPVSHYCSKTVTGLPCLAGTFEIGRGLDAATGVSKLPIKAFSFSGLTDPRIRFEIPDQVHYYDVPVESKASSVQIFKAEGDVRSTIAQDFGIETAFMENAGVMAQHEVTKAVHNYFSTSMFYSRISRVRKLYELRLILSAPLDPEFSRQANSLPTAYDKTEYFRFIAHYGTHIVTFIEYGGQVTLQTHGEKCLVQRDSTDESAMTQPSWCQHFCGNQQGGGGFFLF